MIEFEKDRFDSMFSPKSIAIIGVSKNFMKWGNMIFANIYTEKFCKKGLKNGKIYLINPKHEELLGFKVYPTISSIPEKIDLTYITVPTKLDKLGHEVQNEGLNDVAGTGACPERV
jgi:acetyltransferase